MGWGVGAGGGWGGLADCGIDTAAPMRRCDRTFGAGSAGLWLLAGPAFSSDEAGDGPVVTRSPAHCTPETDTIVDETGVEITIPSKQVLADWHKRLSKLHRELAPDGSGRRPTFDQARAVFIECALPRLLLGIVPTETDERMLFGLPAKYIKAGLDKGLSKAQRLEMLAWSTLHYSDPRKTMAQKPAKDDSMRQTTLYHDGEHTCMMHVACHRGVEFRFSRFDYSFENLIFSVTIDVIIF